MFAGVFYRKACLPAPALGADLLGTLNAFKQADREGVWQDGSFVLAQTLRFNTAESYAEVTPYLCLDNGLLITAWARLDQREQLARKLVLNRPLPELTDPMLILAAWQRWGTDCAAHLQGDFAFAIVDPLRKTLFLARDPVGIRPLYYRLGSAECQFSTTAAVFNQVDSWKSDPDPSWVARYLSPIGIVGSVSRSATAWRDVLKLEPGHCLLVSPEESHLQSYHQFHDNAPFSSRRDPRWVDEYRRILEMVIQEQMRSAHKLGVENSGGIDSATLTSFIARELGEPREWLTSFGFALSEQEPAFILETSQVHRIQHNHIFTNFPRRTDDDQARGLAMLGFPEEHPNATTHSPFYRECQRANIRTLYSGFGGDEVVTNQGNLLRYELLDQGEYAALYGILPGSVFAKSLSLLKTIATRHRRLGASGSLHQAFLARWPFHLLRQSVADELSLFDEGLNAMRFDAPYRRINDFALRGRLYDTFVTARLENCSLIAESYGVDYRWPLLDTRLIQQYLSTPSIEKCGPNGMGRYLHRRAIDGVVPHRVAWKPSKYMGFTGKSHRRNQSGLDVLVNEARRQEAHLHPMLDTLMDRQKFREQIAVMMQGHPDPAFDLVFRRTLNAIRWLNQWLYGRPVD